MSERKLNRRQAWRVEKIQQEREARSKKKERDLDRRLQSGDLSSEQHGLIICRYSRHFEVEALEGADKGLIHRCVSRKNLGTLVAGDKVIWRSGADQTGVIESRLERSSILERPDNFGKLKAVAANINQMLIVIACEPAPQPNLIDRYLVAAELMNIRPILVLNKADLIQQDNFRVFEQLLNRYQGLGYYTSKIVCSRHEATDLDNLPNLIDQRTSIVVGQSGVGKSSFINALLPDAGLEVGRLSHATGEGMHTTTKAKLFHLPGGGQLIDSPGIRDFSLWHIDLVQLQQGFIEIAALLGGCKFRNCQHEHEPGCAVLSAVKEGKISQERFNSYERTKEAMLAQQSR